MSVIFTSIGLVFLKSGQQKEKNYPFRKNRCNTSWMPINKSFQLITAYKAYLPLTSYVVGVSTAALIEIRCKTSENPEVAKQIMKKKVIDLGKTLEESLVYLESL